MIAVATLVDVRQLLTEHPTCDYCGLLRDAQVALRGGDYSYYRWAEQHRAKLAAV